ncbi:MAG: RsmB/NOP family class I SAM-dependent RNA methyltransferase [Clostridia bacterium]|nr:RsmB/NOP family class I SAM-dependent RNA methyltransferase [Clostridia bacterium]
MESIPQFLEEKLITEYGKDTYLKILEGYKTKRNTSIRVNSIKTSIDEIKNVLDKESITYKEVSFYKDALTLDGEQEEKIRGLNIYEDGLIYMQSLSSMIPPLVMDLGDNQDILDMTAAPGGKTTEIASIVQNNANITACEMDKIRCDRLRFNIEKQGARVLVMEKDSRNIDEFFKFDRILLDAPCSGSGTLDLNNEKQIKGFRKELVEKSIKRQLGLIRKAVKILKKGGELVYSTCSILKEENEEVVKEVLKDSSLELVNIEINKKDLPILESLEKTLTLYPTENYEGFFVAKLRKK